MSSTPRADIERVVTAPSTAWPSEFALLAASSSCGWEADSSGSLITTRGRTLAGAGSRPLAWRWIHVISAALSVVGIAATAWPVAAASALPVSITRQNVTSETRLRMVLAPGGGQAIRIRPE